MSKSNEAEIVLTNSVDELVGEPAEQQLASRQAARSRCAGLWMALEQVNRSIDRVEQVAAEPDSLLLVPPNGCG
jgi:hypothetical protein